MGKIPNKFAIMAVDPGGVSGVAQGLFRGDKAGSTSALMKRAVRKGAVKVAEVYGGPDYKTVGYDTGHVHRLIAAWSSFVFHANSGMSIPLYNIYLVFEDFQLRQSAADLAPVQVTAGFESVMVEKPAICCSGLSVGNLPAITKQMPSEAMTYATNARLKLWDLYPLTRGLEHARDATRHLCLKASKILDGES